MAGRLAADLRRRPRASASSGTWAGCTTRSSYFQQDPVYRRYHHHELTFSLDVRVQRELHPAAVATTRSCTARARCCAKMPGDRLAEARQPARAVRLHVGAPRQEAAVHGQRARPGAGVEPRALARLAPARGARATRASSALVRDLNHVYRDQPALWERRLRARRLLLARAQRRRRNVVAFAAARAEGRATCSSASCNLSPVPRPATASALPRAGPLARGAQHRRRASTAASNVGNLGGVEAEARPWHGQPLSRRADAAAARRALADRRMQ